MRMRSKAWIAVFVWARGILAESYIEIGTLE